MCVIVSKHFKDVGWVLVKNRDRNYETTVKMVQTKREGVERLYLFDTETEYSEGLNEHGVSIVSAATCVKEDEKEGLDGFRFTGGPDGKMIRGALLKKTAKEALNYLVEKKMPGNVFVTDGKVCFLLEAGYAQEDEDEENYLSKVIKCDPKLVYVRTNHGLYLPTGYSKDKKGQEFKRESSETRYSVAAKEAKKARDPQELLNAIGVTPSKNSQLNPIRLKKNKEFDMLTTGQILIIPDHKTLTYRPTLSEVELDNYNKINGVSSNTYFEIISNRQLVTFKDFVKK